MRQQRIEKERKPARRVEREVLPLDPRDADVVRVKRARLGTGTRTPLERR